MEKSLISIGVCGPPLSDWPAAFPSTGLPLLGRHTRLRASTTVGHSISRVGAKGSPESRPETDRERGRFTIGVPSITIAFRLCDQRFAKLYNDYVYSRSIA